MQYNILSAAALAACTLATAAMGQNLILNGSFEDNTAGGDLFNMDNATFNVTVDDATAFGDAQEIDIMFGAPYGLMPVDGDYKLAIHRQTGGPVDAFSFDLSSGLVAGNVYTVDFWAQAVTDFGGGSDPIEIGISSSASSFGTLVYATPGLSTSSWVNYTSTFTAPIDADYLTVMNSAAGETWAHIDAFTLVPAPGTLALLGMGGLAITRRRRA